MKEQDLAALVSACLDDGMDFYAIVREVQSAGAIMSIVHGADMAVLGLKISDHPQAPAMLRHVANRIERFAGAAK